MFNPPPENRLIAKIISDNHISDKQSIISILLNEWKNIGSPVTIRPWKHNFYNIAFSNKNDKTNVLRDSPWFVMGFYIALLPWDPDKTLNEMEFDKGQFWVQVHDLPLGMLTSEYASKFAGCLGRLVELDCVGDGPQMDREFLRFRVEVDVENPLVPGFYVRRLNGKETWASVKYEGLGDFCYRCGCLGHCKESCKNEVVEKYAGKWSSDMRTSPAESLQTSTHSDHVSPAEPDSPSPARVNTPIVTVAQVHHSNYCLPVTPEHITPEQCLTRASVPPCFSVEDVNLADMGLRLKIKKEHLADRLQQDEILSLGKGTENTAQVKEVANNHPHSKNVTVARARTEVFQEYDADLTLKCKMSVITDIKEKLKGTPREKMFRKTCFGSWLDLRYTDGDPHLVHLILQKQIDLRPDHDIEEPLIYRVGDHELRFGREEFCLITGLRFGPLDWSLHGHGAIPFKGRVFGHIQGESLRLRHVREVFDDELFMYLPDLDAVRICLLLLLETVFNGREGKLVINLDLLRLVEDLEAWNMFPWGAHVWTVTYGQLKNAIHARRETHLNAIANQKTPKYTLSGFVWAFKIWILEVFSISTSFWMQDPNVIPRALAWHKLVSFSKQHHSLFTDVDEDSAPLRELAPTPNEMVTPWWIASTRIFDGVVDDVPPPTKRARILSGIPIQRDLLHHYVENLHHTVSTMPLSEATSSHKTLEDRLTALEKAQEQIGSSLAELQSEIKLVKQRVSRVEDIVED